MKLNLSRQVGTFTALSLVAVLTSANAQAAKAGTSIPATAIPAAPIGGASGAAAAPKPAVVPWVAPTTPPKAAMTIFNAALKTAKATNRNVFIRFGASWCGWCHKLDAFLETPEGHLLDKYVVIDELIVLENGEKKVLENLGSDSLFKAWGGGDGIPFYGFFTADGKKLSDANAMPKNANIGYPANAAEYAAFDSVLKNGIPAMPDSIRARIMDYISKHP